MRFFFFIFFLSLISFLSAQNPSFKWASAFGGPYPANITPRGIAVDKQGFVYSAGAFNETVDMDPSAASYTMRPLGASTTCIWGCPREIFISKLDSLGNLVWAKQLKGKSEDWAYALTIDSLSNVYVTGSFKDSVDFDPGPLTYYLNSPASTEIFVLKLDPNGNFVWAKHIKSASGGNINAEAYGIAVDDSGYVYTTGHFNSPVDFDPGIGTYTLSPTGINCFVSKLDNAGNFVWAKVLGKGTTGAYGTGIAVDKTGNIFVGGYLDGLNTNGDFDPDAGTYTLPCTGFNNSFITKLNKNGGLAWARAVNGYNKDIAYAMTIDAYGNSFLSGYFFGLTDFDPGPGVFNISPSTNDIYILKLDNLGNFDWVKSFGGSANDVGQALATDKLGNIYCTGYFQNTVDFDPGPGVSSVTSQGFNDCFILKLSTLGNLSWIAAISGSGEETGWALNIDYKGAVHTAGTFTNTPDFDPSTANYFLSAAGTAPSTFIHKMQQPSSVGVTDYEMPEENFSLYPNPTNGEFFIKGIYNSEEVHLYNMLGQDVSFSYISFQKGLKVKLEQPNGIYFIRIGNVIKKIIKQ